MEKRLLKFFFCLFAGWGIAILAYSCLANAEENSFFVKYGVGLNTPEGASTTSIKFVGIGTQAPLTSIFEYQLEAGGYFDNNIPNEVAYGNACIGLAVNQPSYYAKIFSGLALISETDNRLSSYYEFNHDLEIGLKDGRGVGIGLDYKHMSNGGLKLPNRGRDWAGFKLQIPF